MAAKIVKFHQDARDSLGDRVGYYCSYCEAAPHSVASPQSAVTVLSHNWEVTNS